jgi:hypothetical protein
LDASSIRMEGCEGRTSEHVDEYEGTLRRVTQAMSWTRVHRGVREGASGVESGGVENGLKAVSCHRSTGSGERTNGLQSIERFVHLTFPSPLPGTPIPVGQDDLVDDLVDDPVQAGGWKRGADAVRDQDPRQVVHVRDACAAQDDGGGTERGPSEKKPRTRATTNEGTRRSTRRVPTKVVREGITR